MVLCRYKTFMHWEARVTKEGSFAEGNFRMGEQDSARGQVNVFVKSETSYATDCSTWNKPSVKLRRKCVIRMISQDAWKLKPHGVVWGRAVDSSMLVQTAMPLDCDAPQRKGNDLLQAKSQWMSALGTHHGRWMYPEGRGQAKGTTEYTGRRLKFGLLLLKGQSIQS